MSSSAFRNVIQRRAHHERHQPEARARFGLLEKHKDYVQRARNYHSKEKRLIELRRKAENRNPDEFYHKMLSTRTKGGVHAAKSERPQLDADMLRLLKTQDATYVATMKSAEDGKIARLRATLHGAGGGGARGNTRTVFLDEDEEGAEGAAGGATADAGVSFADAFARTVAEEKAAAATAAAAAAADAAAASTAAAAGDSRVPARKARKSARAIERASADAYAELAAREARSAKLGQLGAHMNLQRALLAPGKRKKVKDAAGNAPAAYVWKAARKR